MTVSEWLDSKEAEDNDVSHILPPDDLANSEQSINAVGKEK